MKKTLRFSLLSMLLMLCGISYAQQVTLDFDNDYANLFPTLAGTSSNESHDGDFTEATTSTAVNGVTVTVAPADDAKTPSRIWSSAPRLRMYSGTFTVSGKDITKIEFTGHSSNFNLSTTTGNLSEKTWTGKANDVVFEVSKNTQINKIVVTLGEGGDTPGPDPDGEAVANIAAFKALAKGTEATLTLKDVEVLYVNGTNDMYVRDASGAIDFFRTGLTYTAGQKLNGSVTGKYDLYQNTPEMVKTDNTNGDKITATNGTVTAKSITAAEVKNNICDLVKLSGVTVTESEGKYYVDDVQIYDKFKVVAGTPEAGKTYDIEGIAIMYNDVVEICPISDYTSGSTPGPGPEIQTVANIAAFKALANNTEAVLTLKDAEVLYVNGTNDMYVRDASGAIDFFRTGLTYTAGQKLNGSITGKYTLYQNTPELAKTDNTNDEKITAATGTVTAKNITVAEVKNNICDLVKLTGVTVTESEGKYYIDDVQIYDKFKVVTGTTQSGQTYDIEGIAIMYNDVVEICPVSDYTAGTTPAELTISGEANFDESTVVTITPSDVDHDVYYTIDGTDPKTSNSHVRYMGPFTITETCTVKAWEEDADIYAEKKFTKNTVEVVEVSVEDVIAAAPENTNAADGQQKVWVTGYIVGYVEGQAYATGAHFDAYGCEVKTNLLLATNYYETNIENCIPVQLPSGDVRNDLNLQDHPDNFGKEVKLYGYVLKYFGVPGFKNVTAYEFTGNTSVNAINADTVKDGKMYNVAGQRVDKSYKGIVIVGGKKFVVK